MFCHALHFVVVFFGPFSIVITSLGEERTGPCVSRALFCLFCTRYFLAFCLPLGARVGCGL